MVFLVCKIINEWNKIYKPKTAWRAEVLWELSRSFGPPRRGAGAHPGLDWVLSNSHFVVHYVTLFLWLNVCMRQDWSLVFCKAPQQMKPWLLEEISLGIYLLTLLGSPKLTELPGIRARMYLCFLNSVGLGWAKGGVLLWFGFGACSAVCFVSEMWILSGWWDVMAADPRARWEGTWVMWTL